MLYKRLSPTSALVQWESHDQFLVFISNNKGQYEPLPGTRARWVLPNNASDLSRWVEVTGPPNAPELLHVTAAKLEVHRKQVPAMIRGYQDAVAGQWHPQPTQQETDDYRIGQAALWVDKLRTHSKQRPPLYLPGET
jgi:hypothetical protein